MEYVKREQFTLDIIKARAQTVILKEMANKELSLSFDLQVQEMVSKIVLIMTVDYLGKQQEKVHHYITYPNWKERFKWDNKNKWWMKRWIKKRPIKFQRNLITYTKNTVFPDIVVPSHLKGANQVTFYEIKSAKYTDKYGGI